MESTINNAQNTIGFEVLQENVETIDKLRLTIYKSKCRLKPDITSMKNSEDLKQIVSSLNQVLDNIIRSRTELACARDFISVQLDTSDNDTVFVPYQRLPISSNFLHQLNKYSESTYSLDDPFEITIRIITAPENIKAGRSTSTCESPDTFYKRKKCLIVMNNDDNLCGFYAISLGHWLINHPDYLVSGSSSKRQWHGLRRSLTRGGLNTIKQLARNFCMFAGLTLQTITISMLPSIQERFKEQFQLVVFERPRTKTTKINKLFVGLSSATQKVLLEYVNNKENGHINLITSVTGYLDTPKYCWECYTPFRQRHSCSSGTEQISTSERRTTRRPTRSMITSIKESVFKILVFLLSCVSKPKLSVLLKCNYCVQISDGECGAFCNKSLDFSGNERGKNLNDFIFNVLSPCAKKHGGRVIVIGYDNDYKNILEDFVERELMTKELILKDRHLVKLSTGNVIFRNLANFRQQTTFETTDEIMREYIYLFEMLHNRTGLDFLQQFGSIEEFALQVFKSTMNTSCFSNKSDRLFKCDEDILQERMRQCSRQSSSTTHARIQDTCFSIRQENFEQRTLASINLKLLRVTDPPNGLIFPVGKPMIVSPPNNRREQDVSSFFGFIRCSVIVPISSVHGLLPVLRFGHFIYPNFSKGDNKTSEERTFTGTWATPELLFALEHGYQIKHIFEILHYDQRIDIYGKYTNKWIGVKNNITERLLALPWWLGANTSQSQGMIAQHYSDQLEVLKPEYEITSQTEISTCTVAITYKYKSRQPLGPLHPDVATAAFAAAYKRLHLNKEISALTMEDAIILRVDDDKIWYSTKQTRDSHLNEKYIASGKEAMALLEKKPDDEIGSRIVVGRLVFKPAITQYKYTVE